MFAPISSLIQVRAEDLGWLSPQLPEERRGIMVPEFLEEEKRKRLKRAQKEKPKDNEPRK